MKPFSSLFKFRLAAHYGTAKAKKKIHQKAEIGFSKALTNEISAPSQTSETFVKIANAEDRVYRLIILQSFAGYFDLEQDLVIVIYSSFKTSGDILQKLKDLAAKLGVPEQIVATWAAVVTFEQGEGHTAERDTWNLVVEKAVVWLDGEEKNDAVLKRHVAGVITV
ncbi:hypothetical protein ABW20_dc0106186 [Dactylellina cionopaga]|nr:hypothetical protein ABW20_dc0106186 [Dactylellina cionopaga]